MEYSMEHSMEHSIEHSRQDEVAGRAPPVAARRLEEQKGIGAHVGTLRERRPDLHSSQRRPVR